MAIKKGQLTDANGNILYLETSIDQVDGLQTALDAKAAESSVPDSLADLSEDSTHRTVTDTEKSTWNAKGTYSKPSGGIPSTDMTSAVQTSLGKADTALQTETDPVFTASAAHGISSSDIANWNAKENSSNKVTSFSSPTDTQYPSAKLVNDQLALKGTYSKPSGGIPSTDLASAVQTSLGKADTAIQSVTVGTTTTGAAGSNASVTNTGTSTNPVLTFTIPQGAQGVKGDTVIIGGESSYTLYNTTGDNTDGAMTQAAVTAELTELGGDVFDSLHTQEAADLSLLALKNFYVGPRNVWVSSQDYCGKFLPVNDGEIYTLTSPSDNPLVISIVKSTSQVNGSAPDFSSSFPSRIVSETGEPYTVTIPSDAHYIYVRTKNNGADITPTVVRTREKYALLSDVDSLADEIEDLVVNGEELFDLAAQRASLGTNMSSDRVSDSYITTTRSNSEAKWTFQANTSSVYLLWITLPTLVVGKKYKISFILDNSSGSTLTATIRDVNRSVIDTIGTGYTTGSVYTITYTFVYSSDMYIFGVAAKPISGNYISIYDISVKEQIPIKDATNNLQAGLTEVISDVGEWDEKKTILGSSIPSCGANISSNTGKWTNTTGYYAGLVDVEAHRNKNLVLTGGNVNSGACYTFTTAGVDIGNTPSYATDYGAPRSLAANTSITITVPSDAKYLYVYLESPGVDYRPQSIVIPMSITDTLEDVSSKVNTVSDVLSSTYLTTSMLEQGGTNNNTGADYSESTNVRTKYLPLGEATSVIIHNNKTVDGHSLLFKFAWYDANKEYKSYTTWTSKTSALIPVSALGGFVRIVFSRSPSATTVPSDIAQFELFLNIYGQDTLVNRVEALETKEEDENTSVTAQIIKGLAPNSITFCTWNIGHFSLGRNKNSDITGADYATKLAQFKDFIYNTINPRVIALNEYSAVFGTDSNSVRHNTADVLFNDFAMKFEGTQSNYSCNALFGNTYLSSIKQCAYQCLQNETITHTNAIEATDYYYVMADLYMEGRLVKLVSTHLAFDSNRGGVLQSAQMQELIDTFSDYERVIITGDMNLSGNNSRYEVFTNAGYTLGNDGSIVTYPSGGSSLDNIIYKGVVVSDVRAITNSLSDHYPLVATITVYRKRDN